MINFYIDKISILSLLETTWTRFPIMVHIFVFVLASGGKYCFYDQQLGSIWFDMPESVQSRMESTFLILHLIYILYFRNPKNIISWFQFTLYAAKSRHITSL